MNSSKPIIEVKNIGKKYNITHQKGSYIALRDVLMNVIKSPFSFLKTKVKQVAGFEKKEDFWALKDINISLKHGETLGIVGKNGAGKSTLLKCIAGITKPTHGEIKVNGKIAGLIELGAGFHHDLTGRENIFLYGAILGMSKKEIKEKFEEIVAFAELAEWLDTPIKFYSSGMFARLGFAIVIHSNPDILLIDEALAVGDQQFQDKCYAKIEEFKNAGKIIVLVSHSTEALRQHSSCGILIENGTLKQKGNIEHIITSYQS